MEGKVAVFGNSDFVMPFSALGLDTYQVEAGENDIAKAAEDLLQKNYALIVVSESIATEAQVAFEGTEKKTLPSIVVVPFTTESKGFALRSLGKVLKLATGIDIISN